MEKLIEAKKLRDAKLNKIEQIKSITSPLEFWNDFETICKSGLENLTDVHKNFLLKCFGIFYKDDGTFMLRIRIPAGQLEIYQALSLGQIAKKFGNNYIDITTRQQIELRYLKLEDLPKVIDGLRAVEITTFQTGIDNFRNIVTSSFDGIGNVSLVECRTFIEQMQDIFLEKDEWIGTLPRKFNTAILGTKFNDCNIYGHDCSFIVAQKGSEIGFNLYLGGKVGVQGEDFGIFIKQNQVIQTYEAVINLFKEFGFRDNRNKNRLHFLLESVGIDEFTKAIKEYSQIDYESSGEILCTSNLILDRYGRYFIGSDVIAYNFSIPSGIFNADDMINIAKLADDVNGKIRLSVEQSLYIIAKSLYDDKIRNSAIYNKYSYFQNPFFTNMVACAGTKTCSFGVVDSKGLAIRFASLLKEEFPDMTGKIKFYWSGCPKGCGIHGVGDIGFEGCITKNNLNEKVDGVHIFIGGKSTKKAEEARVFRKSVSIDDALLIVRNLIEFYCSNRLDALETFEDFDDRVLSLMNMEEMSVF